LKQGDGLAPILFNIAYRVCNKTAVSRSQISDIVQIITTNRICSDLNIMERTKTAISEVYKELKERAKDAGLNIIIKKTTEVVSNRKTRIRS